MTTHEAIALQPITPIHHAYLKQEDKLTLTGKASPEHPLSIRVIWDNLAESDSVIQVSDRMSLAAIAIDHPTAEPEF